MISSTRKKINAAIYIFILLSKLNGYWSLKNVQLKSKIAVRRSDNLKLECDYDLENALLYSIKWYFEDNEFYRFVPKESPPTRVFLVPGISVDLSQSDNKAVTLRNVQRNLTGFYKCEISADAPLFHTDIKSTCVFVTDPPEKAPVILSQKSKQRDSEVITAVCSAGKAYPAANLTWSINGEVLNSRTVKMLSSVSSDINGMETATSKLEILVSSNPGIFIDGRLKLKCEAWQYDVYGESVEIEIVEDAPQLAHVLSQPKSDSCKGKYENMTWIIIVLIMRTVDVLLHYPTNR